MDYQPHWKQSEVGAAEFIDPLRCNLWSLIIPAAASLIGGYLSGKGDEAAADAERDAANANVNLQRQIYQDQRGLARPGYMTGGAATNLLAAQFGIAPQDYTAAYNGLNTGPMGYGDLGAGQPVAGHTGGGGPNGLIGGLIRNGGDNWTTIATQAPAGFDYNAYMQAPDLAAEWAKPDVQALFGGNRDAYANWHYNQYGRNEGRQLNPIAQSQSPQPIGDLSPAGGSANGLVDPMAGFMASPYGKIATSGFRGVDVPEVNSAFARGGKLLSGAQSIALDERGKARLGGAYTDYTNGLRSLAGLNQTASSQVSGAAGQYGVNAGNATMAAGAAKGDALRSGYNGLSQGLSGALGTVMDFGKQNWGWT